MTYDYKQLCAELVDSIELLLEMRPVDARPLKITEERLHRARAALSEPEPEGPTDEEVDMWADDNNFVKGHGDHPCGFWVNDDDLGKIVRAALARWGNHPESPDSSMQPIPVSERLPGDQLCWWYEPDEEDGYGGMWTLLRIRGGTARYSHWLPADALPQPS